MAKIIIDSHMHCGIQNSNLPFETVKRYIDAGGIDGACLYAPVEDIYDRYDYNFQDNSSWVNRRQHANRYLLNIQGKNKYIFAYYFVWNDFRKDELQKGYKGIKWHRHEYEPTYNYNDPLCEEFLQEVYRLQLPIVFEESFKNTCYFINRVNGRTPVIIPHMGGLNGGFSALFKAGLWENDTVYADTALASRREMEIFLEKYGSEKLIFGSDFPFSTPESELDKVIRLKLSDGDFDNVVSKNILRLLKYENCL